VKTVTPGAPTSSVSMESKFRVLASPTLPVKTTVSASAPPSMRNLFR
jgi:hypothetical protein